MICATHCCTAIVYTDNLGMQGALVAHIDANTVANPNLYTLSHLYTVPDPHPRANLYPLPDVDAASDGNIHARTDRYRYARTHGNAVTQADGCSCDKGSTHASG